MRAAQGPANSGCTTALVGNNPLTPRLLPALFMNEWNIQSRAHACTACGQPFTDKQTYHTALFDDRVEFSRHDLCQACWERDFAPDARTRKGFISCWQGVYEAPAPRPEVIQKGNAEALLREIMQRNDPAHAAAAYILAVMLERKRLLRVKEQLVRDGRRIFVYEQPKTGDVFTITDPALQLNQLAVVQRDVAHLLEHGLPAAESSAAPAPEPQSPVPPENSSESALPAPVPEDGRSNDL
jgi:hypothetical protein